MSVSETRVVPSAVFRKWRIWRNSAMGWKTLHYVAGFVSAALSAILAIDTKTRFLDSTSALIIASLAAGLSFLVTTMGAQERATMLERAAWELEAAMALYRTDDQVSLSELGKAEARAVQILKAGR